MLTERIEPYVGVCRLSQMSTTTSDDLKCKPSLQIQDLFFTISNVSRAFKLKGSWGITRERGGTPWENKSV